MGLVILTLLGLKYLPAWVKLVWLFHLLRADLWKCFEHFKGYGKDALLLTLLAYNVGVGRLLGYGKHSKSRLLRKIEAGDRNFYREYVSFCRYKGKVLRGLVKRRKIEFALFYMF